MALSWEDKEKLNAAINQLTRSLPPIAKMGLANRSIPDLLMMIPQEFRKYTLAELIDAVKDSWDKKEIGW